MKKEIIELARDKNVGLGFHRFGSNAPTEEGILDAIVSFAKGKNIKIYSHAFSEKFEEHPEYGKGNCSCGQGHIQGDSVYSLAVYYQEL